jgi:23S rRNA pseudouridine1911/1915/1917 synthase
LQFFVVEVKVEKDEERHIVHRDFEGARLDRFVVDRSRGISRSRAHSLIKEGHILLNGEIVKPHHKVHTGDEVRVTIPPPVEAEADPENIPLDILYEDRDLLVVNKAAGMIVHPAAGVSSGTLVNALLAHCASLSGVGGVLKQGIVHRLDKGTSGCMVVAKNDEAHRGLSEQFARREIGKEYLGIVHGSLGPDSGVVEGLIARHPTHRKKMSVRHDAGKESETRFEVLERYHDFTYLKLTLLTGRTHQIRVHMAHMGHPILGDELYGRKGKGRVGLPGAGRPMLHAWRLVFRHPVKGKTVRMEAPLPRDMERVLEHLRHGDRAGKTGKRPSGSAWDDLV